MPVVTSAVTLLLYALLLLLLYIMLSRKIGNAPPCTPPSALSSERERDLPKASAPPSPRHPRHLVLPWLCSCYGALGLGGPTPIRPHCSAPMWGRTDRSTAEHTAQRWGCTAWDAELFQKHFVLLLRLAEQWGNSDRTHLQNPNPDGAVISSRKRSAAHICAQRVLCGARGSKQI